MRSEDLTFFGSDPGAAKYGNFINYYSFHSAKQRVDNLSPEMFYPISDEPILCLDIGCNTGDLTKELYSYLKNIYPGNIQMLGVDIDPTLIQRAQEMNNSGSITFNTANVMTESGHEMIKQFLASYKRENFDITFCFSVTMWIHINNGDKGLQEFLKFIKDISNTIVIEPQPWNCYRNAQRRVRKSGSTFPSYETLKIRSNVYTAIENLLAKDTHRKVYESSATLWKRKIQSYQRT